MGINKVFDGVVKWTRHETFAEVKGNGNDEETVFFGSIENTFSVAEFKVFVCQSTEGSR